MKKLLIILFLAINLPVFAQDATKQNYLQEKEFVKKYVLYAKGYVEQNGKLKSVTDFNNATHDAYNRGLYIFGFVCGTKQMDGFTLINPASPERIFTDTSNDPIVQKLVQAALAAPEGVWVAYDWRNPKTQQVQQKMSFVIFLPKEQLCLGSGVYR